MARQRTQPRFDPYGILAALEEEWTAYVLIGAFARVIEGSDEITHGLDVTPSTQPENLRRRLNFGVVVLGGAALTLASWT